MERILGVGCDGCTFVFVRQRGKNIDVEDPQQVTARTVDRLLRAIVSLGARGLSFTPENLSAHFGSLSKTAEEGIRRIHDTIHGTQSIKAKTFFRQWQILFGEVCGYDIHSQSAKIKELAKHYSIVNPNPSELLFAVHTYYAIFIKLLAAEIVTSFSPLATSPLKKLVTAPTILKLRDELRTLEQGGIWSQLGIRNFLEGDLFSWYLDAWDKNCADAIHSMTQSLDQFDPTTLSVDPTESRDLLKQLYQQLFPRSVRHDLGEYYTPDWLAELVLDELKYDGNPDKRLLDPACGSGTFLVMAINRVKTWFEAHRHECGFDESELLHRVLRNIIGFDLNPLAVMAARTNYLMAIRDLLRHVHNVELPIYLCDSIMTPFEYGDLFTGAHGKVRQLKTSVGEFIIPNEIAESREKIGKYADTLEFCILNRYSSAEFLERCQAEGIPVTEVQLHEELYRCLQKIDADNNNGIWARIIKNAFAPLFIGTVDFVAGNPPWINWRNLPPEYRTALAPLWTNYGLFTHKGLQARLGSGMDDLSVLMLFVAVDNYLEIKGKLSFIITQTIFKSAGGGQGFRKLKLSTGKYLNVCRVLDLSNAQPFEGATNRTAIVSLSVRNKENKYPVDYRIYLPQKYKKIPSDSSLAAVQNNFSIKKLEAFPLSDESGSSWITLPKGLNTKLQKIRGSSRYRGRIGAHSGGASGVFWVEILNDNKTDYVIRNLFNAGRNKFDEVTQSVEKRFVRPLIRGRDLRRWVCHPSLHILIPYCEQNSGKAVSINELKKLYPKTYRYFRLFESRLINRPHYRQHFEPTGQPYYSMYNVGDYTFAAHRIAWREQSSTFQCAVISSSENDLSVADAKLIVVACGSTNEAYYLAGCLNSSPVRLFVDSYSIQVQISTHVLHHVNIPVYDEKNSLHKIIVELSKRCHDLADKGDVINIAKNEAKLDQATASLWDINESELQSIQSALEEMSPLADHAQEEEDDEDD